MIEFNYENFNIKGSFSPKKSAHRYLLIIEKDEVVVFNKTVSIGEVIRTLWKYKIEWAPSGFLNLLLREKVYDDDR